MKTEPIDLLNRIIELSKIIGTADAFINNLNDDEKNTILSWAQKTIDELGDIICKEIFPKPHIKSEYAALAIKLVAISSTLDNNKKSLDRCTALFTLFHFDSSCDESAEKVIRDILMRKIRLNKENKNEQQMVQIDVLNDNDTSFVKKLPLLLKIFAFLCILNSPIGAFFNLAGIDQLLLDNPAYEQLGLVAIAISVIIVLFRGLFYMTCGVMVASGVKSGRTWSSLLLVLDFMFIVHFCIIVAKIPIFSVLIPLLSILLWFLYLNFTEEIKLLYNNPEPIKNHFKNFWWIFLFIIMSLIMMAVIVMGILIIVNKYRLP